MKIDTKVAKYIPTQSLPDNCILIRVRKDGQDMFHRFINTGEKVDGHLYLFDTYIKYLQDNFTTFFSKH